MPPINDMSFCTIVLSILWHTLLLLLLNVSQTSHQNRAASGEACCVLRKEVTGVNVLCRELADVPVVLQGLVLWRKSRQRRKRHKCSWHHHIHIWSWDLAMLILIYGSSLKKSSDWASFIEGFYRFIDSFPLKGFPFFILLKGRVQRHLKWCSA